MNDQIQIQLGEKLYKVKKDVKVIDFLNALKYDKSIIAVKVNGNIKNLNYILSKDVSIDLVKYNSAMGNKIYVNGLKFLFIIATKEILGANTEIIFEHSIDKGIYTTINSNQGLNGETIKQIATKMYEYINNSEKIDSINVSKKDLLEYYNTTNQKDKLKSLETNTSEFVKINKCLKYYAYFYGTLPINMSYVSKFKISFLGKNNVVLRYPIVNKDYLIPDYVHHKKIIDIFDEYNGWLNKLDVYNVGDLNSIISHDKIKEFILINEYMQFERLTNIGNNIVGNIDKSKLILIAGPSSSGKTTSANKLCMYLKSRGIKTHLISTDDYFKDRDETPKDENGEYNFDDLDALDLSLFNDHLKKLINGEEVEIPIYNFFKGIKEYNGRKIKLDNNSILVVEGIHALNEKLTSEIPREEKTKIYLAPFTPLNIDNYNYISTRDIRLLRRIVRDNRTRGRGVIDTLKGWEKVKNGEEKYIFCFQDEADFVFNTAIIYETGVIKTYVEPLLYSVPMDSEYYQDAKRLIEFLRLFFPIPAEYVPADSILREFIGNSCFYD